MENVSTSRKRKRGRYKRYVQDASITVPRQTAERWRKEDHGIVLSSTDTEEAVYHTSSQDDCIQDAEEAVDPLENDLAEEEHYHLQYEEYADTLDEAGDDNDLAEAEHHDLQPEEYADILDDAENDNEDGFDDDIFYDAPLPPEDEQPNQGGEELYAGAPLTKSQSVLLISAYAIRHNLTQSATQDLLTLINEHLPRPSVPSTNYLLRKACMVDLGKEDIIYHAYCGSCSGYLGTEDNLTCDTCNVDTTKARCVKKGSFFISISIASQLKHLLSTPSILEKLQFNVGENRDGSLEDITDGSFYKGLRSDVLGEHDLTLTFNSDGISAFHSSNSSIWPILCTVNELPVKDRKKHVLMAGIWFGSGKPEMQTFLRSFVSEFEDIAEDGLTWWNPTANREITSKVYAIACACDSVARCQLQGLVQFNGYYGCGWCLHPGTRHENRHVYPSQNRPHQSRTKESFTRKAIEARETGVNCDGVKPHPSPLLLLPHFDIVCGFPVDYMHSVCEGTTQKLFSLWFDSCYHQEEWYLGRRVPEIDERVQQIVPPSEVTRIPTSPSQRAQWKASEFRAWLLFYCLPVLNGFLPEQFLQHVLLLVKGIWLLTKSNVTVDDVSISRACLTKFVSRMEFLYGVVHMSYNVHTLLHLPDTVAAWGPLWTTSCFLFEGYNRTIKSLFHGTRGVPHQISNNFAIVQGLSKRIDAMDDADPELGAFYRSLVTGYPLVPSVCKLQSDDGTVLLKGKSSAFQAVVADDNAVVADFFQEPLENLQVTEYYKAAVDGIAFQTGGNMIRSKRDDSVVAYGPNHVGRVKKIIRNEVTSQVVVLIQPFLVDASGLVTDERIGASAGHIVALTDQPLMPPFVLPVSHSFHKCVQIVIDDTHYCCILPNMTELD